jgi:hypothetical protein
MMPRAKTNLSATRASIRVLHKTGRLGPEYACVEALALSLAGAMDSVLADPEAKKYVVPPLARSQLAVLQTLLGGLAEDNLDPFQAFVEGLSAPTLDR